MAPNPRTRRLLRPVLAYVAAVMVPLAAAYAVVRSGGGTSGGAGGGGVGDLMYGLLRAVVLVVVAAHLLGAACERIGQPRLAGEMLAGLLLGPSCLGALAPGAEAALFGPALLPVLNVLAQLGVVFFMFIVGLELPLPLLRRSGARALVIGHGAIATPFLVGAVLALVPLRGLRPAGAPEVPYVMFVGLALAVTALPVLARILTDHGLGTSRLGAFGLACAAVGDVTVWCLLVFVVAVARGGSAWPVLRTVLLAVAFGAAMWWLVRPAADRVLRRAAGHGPPRGLVVALTLAAVLASAYVADLIGVHVIFGAFAAGLAAPRDCPPVTALADKLGAVTSWFLLPLFFAYIGLRTALGAVGGAAGWLLVALVVAAAVASKSAGTLGSAAHRRRLAGHVRADDHDELPRSHRAGRPGRRPVARRHRPPAVRHAGGDGAGHHGRVRRAAGAGQSPRCVIAVATSSSRASSTSATARAACRTAPVISSTRVSVNSWRRPNTASAQWQAPSSVTTASASEANSGWTRPSRYTGFASAARSRS